MSGLLERIVVDKRAHLARAQATCPLPMRIRQADAQSPPRGFLNALRAAHAQGRYGLIAEIKKASPSAGLIRADFDSAALARAYAGGGASCLSILTDTPYFQGEDGYLTAAREACTLPVLRKDFIIDPYQVVEARAIGADAVLLIAAILDDEQLETLMQAAAEWGLDVLMEVHNEAELARVLPLNPPLIGINNRNLDTLQIGLETSFELKPQIPAQTHVVAESGLKTKADLDACATHGITSFLIGESLMRQSDVTAATKALLG